LTKQKPRSENEVARDHKLIAEYYQEGFSQYAIKEKLLEEHEIKRSVPTICRDLKKITDGWFQNTNIEIDKIKIVEMRKLDKTYDEALNAWKKSIEANDHGIGNHMFLKRLIEIQRAKWELLNITDTKNISLINNQVILKVVYGE